MSIDQIRPSQVGHGNIKMALTRTSEQVPFAEGRLMLGAWQGIFLWEHRRAPHSRRVVLTFVGE